MTSCRKIIDVTSNTTKERYLLISGKRKEAMDACKNAFHSAYHLRIREYTDSRWKELETWLLEDTDD